MRRLVLALAVASSAVATGCASGGGSNASPPFYRPEVSLRSVRLTGAGITGGALDVALRLYNPNDYALRSPRVAYRLYVGGHEVAEDAHDVRVVVPPGDSVDVVVPVKVGYTSIAHAGRSMLADGTVDYRVRGKIYVDTPHGRLAAPYDREGRFAPLTTALDKASR